MRRFRLAVPLAGRVVGVLMVTLASVAFADSPPRIIGISHITFHVSDVDTAKAFYGDYLGYDVKKNPASSYAVQHPDIAKFAINSDQSIDLIQEKTLGDRLVNLTFRTDNPEALRQLFKSRGIAVPEKILQFEFDHQPIANLSSSFSIMDPDGHILSFEKPGTYFSLPVSQRAISSRMTHAGILVSSADASIKFYRDQLGFAETWRGSRDNKILSWVNLKVPDGNDYVEFMLYSKLAEPTKRGTQHHICLEVPDVKKAWEILKTRSLPKECKAPTEMKTGVNGKRQINLFDPDGTRIEIMEPATFDGRPVQPSTAPAPQGEPLITELMHAKAAEGVPHYVTRATSP
jgi:catechol 2,3-dioxygenase-like lactoylglutathione lyase family enzyme